MSSLVIIVPRESQAAANEALEQAGYGPNNLSIPMRGVVRVESDEQATHYGTHWWVGDEIDDVVSIVKGASPTNLFLSDTQLDGTEYRAASGYELFDGEAGDVFYIPVKPSLVDVLNEGLAKIVGLGDAYAKVIRPPAEGMYALLEVREKDIVPISVEADESLLSEVLSVFVADGALTAEEQAGIVGAVQALAGKTVEFRQFIPASWQPFVMTRYQAEQAGYFPKD